MRALVASIVLLIALGHSLAGAPRVREYLDEVTAASITMPLEPLVFAREHPELAVNARDYVTLVPLEINRSGHRSYFWLGYFWSTIDRRGGAPLIAPTDQLVLLADGRPIALESDARTLREHGIGRPPVPVPARTATALLFTSHPEEIAYAADAHELRIEVIRVGASDSFVLWKDSRWALRELARRLGD